MVLEKTFCGEGIWIMSVKQADVETEAQIAPKGVFCIFFLDAYNFLIMLINVKTF